MKITIKTLDEARASRVEMTFESDPTGEHVIAFSRRNAEAEIDLVRVDDTLAGSPKWSDHRVVTSLNDVFKWDKNTLYTREVVMDLQASEAELAAVPLKRRITELERMLSNNQGQTEKAEKLAAEMKERAEKAENMVASYRSDLHGHGGVWDKFSEAKKLAAQMKERAEQAEKRAEMFKASAYQADDKGANDRQRIKLARQALRRYFPESLITDDVAPLITELITAVKDLRGRVDEYRESSERCERELHDAHVSIESRDRLLSTATTALRKIAMEVAVQDFVQPVAKKTDIIDNVRDLASPWADTSSEDKARRPLYQA